MQVKKFEAPTIQEALEHVKRELGPEAVILQTKKNKRGFGLLSGASVEITAAVSDRSLQKKQVAEVRLPDKNKDVVRSMPADKQARVYEKYMNQHLERAQQTQEKVELGNRAKKITATRYIDIPDDGNTGGKSERKEDPKGNSFVPSKPIVAPTVVDHHVIPPAEASFSLENEIQYLKKIVEELKATPERNHGTALDIPALQNIFEQLVIAGIERRHVLALIKKVAFELGPDRSKRDDQVFELLVNELMESVEVLAPLSHLTPKAAGESRSPAVIAFMGPTGVGKTTTLAKLAGRVIENQRLKVGLVNLDQRKVAAFEQLGTYARILNVPFRSAANAQDLKACLADFQSLDLVFLDTSGISQRNPDGIKEIQNIIKSFNEIRTFLVLSATTRDSDLYEIESRFSVFRPQGLIFSKLDEATVYGSIYNLSQKVKIPLLYFTTGQSVPEDIEEATRERLVSLLMEI